MHSMLVRALVGRGVDVRTALDCGMIHRSDEDHLQYATAEGRVLFSYNIADYCRIHDEVLQGWQVARGDLTGRPAAILRGRATAQDSGLRARVSPREMKSRLEFLSRWRAGR